MRDFRQQLIVLQRKLRGRVRFSNDDLAGDDPEAIVLYFMDPELARRQSRRFGRQAWRDEARRQGHASAL